MPFSFSLFHASQAFSQVSTDVSKSQAFHIFHSSLPVTFGHPTTWRAFILRDTRYYRPKIFRDVQIQRHAFASFEFQWGRFLDTKYVFLKCCMRTLMKYQFKWFHESCLLFVLFVSLQITSLEGRKKEKIPVPAQWYAFSHRDPLGADPVQQKLSHVA